MHPAVSEFHCFVVGNPLVLGGTHVRQTAHRRGDHTGKISFNVPRVLSRDTHVGTESQVATDKHTTA